MGKETKGDPRLAKGLRMMGLNGSAYRTITSIRPNIHTPLTAPKKGNGQHKVKDVFGKKAYQYNDALTSAYIILQEKAAEQRKDTFFITVTLDDATTMKLREQNVDKGKETMIRTVSRWFRAYDYITDAIVVMEVCSDSVVEYKDNNHRRLHLHIVTTLNDNDSAMIRRDLLKDKRIQIQVQDTWTDKRPYTEFDEWEEEEFGSIPVGAVDPDADYWMNTYVRKIADKATGKITREVCRELPVCLRSVDYMSKSILKPIGRGKNYTLIGLEGHRERREELSRRARELLSE
ncbi:TPA: hypothetical protein ACGUXQ_004675 [Vibrio vulnificus]|nr:hypothetical protein [Vibrio vulnificus]HDY7607752.1 hypothetical protein [Vibrio vulnificus]